MLKKKKVCALSQDISFFLYYRRVSLLSLVVISETSQHKHHSVKTHVQCCKGKKVENQIPKSELHLMKMF